MTDILLTIPLRNSLVATGDINKHDFDRLMGKNSCHTLHDHKGKLYNALKLGIQVLNTFILNCWINTVWNTINLRNPKANDCP